MMVTPLPPVKSVKTALASTHTIARPPGSQPTHERRRAHETLRRLRFGHRVADEREERDGGEDRRAREARAEDLRREATQELLARCRSR